VFSAGEGLSVRRHAEGPLLIESVDGIYRLFEPTPGNPSHLRLSQLGDRNDNRLLFDYDVQGRLRQLRDTFNDVRIELAYSQQWSARVEQIERLYPDHSRETLASYAYDARGDLAEVRDAAGLTQRCFAYDSGQRLVEHQLPTGLRCFYQWACVDGREWRVTRHWTDDGDEYRFDYDLSGRVTRITDCLQRVSTRRWNPQYQITEYTDTLGQTWRFDWNAQRQLLGATDPQGGRWQFSYDESGNLCSIQDPLGRIESTAWLEHWSLPLIETDAAGHTTRYQYDRRGQLRQRVDAHGRQVGFRYDAYGRLQTLTNENGEHDGQVISDFERDRLHREVLRTQGQLTTRSEYDRCGRLRLRKRSPTGQPRQLPAAHQKIFEYDPADHLIARQQGSQRQLLHYDATSRILATQDNTQGQQETFAYDAAANLLDGPQPGAGWVRHNKLLAYQDKRYRYDGFGRMIEKRSAVRGLQRFTYDAEHRLIEVRSQKSGRETRVKMAYDPLGRRIAKTEHDSNGYVLGEIHFDWQGLRLLQERRPGQTSVYIYEDEGYAPLARVDGTGAYQQVRYYHNDLNGLPEELTETDGQTVWRARYQVWGNTTEEVREPHFIEEQNLRFQGQYLDRETGLHYNTFRFYDPEVGRFTTPDPIGLMGGFNLYRYAPNPINWIDPWGWVSSNPGVYDVWFEAYIGKDIWQSKDAVHFAESNRQLHYAMKNDPAFRGTVEMKYPGISDWVAPKKNGKFRSTALAGSTWHHHPIVGGNLQLVSYADHKDRHGDYHPRAANGKRVGGRKTWGGGSSCRK